VNYLAESLGPNSPFPQQKKRESKTTTNESNTPLAEHLPVGEGRNIVITACVKCHEGGLKEVVSARKTQAQWNATIAKMVSAGARLTPEESSTIENYLSKAFPPEKPIPQDPQQQDKE
jgi:cytochrome c5